MTVFSSLVTPQSLVFTTMDGRTHNVTNAHPNYERMKGIIGEMKAAIAAKGATVALWESLERMVDVSGVITKGSGGRIQVKGGVILFNGQSIANPVCDRILWGVRENIPMDSYIRFLDKLLDNPSRTAVKETYLFLEHNSMGLADDGDVIGYKKVRGNYKDIWSGTIDNSVGQIPEMERNDVDDNRHVTCSTGLHFCSFNYLSNYGSNDAATDRVMIVKVNPRDIVSVPGDYKNAKVRCCRYEVVGEYKAEPTKRRDVLADKPVWSRNQLALDAPKPVDFGEDGVAAVLNYRSAAGNLSERKVFVKSVTAKGNLYTLHCDVFDTDDRAWVFRSYRSDRIQRFEDVMTGVVIEVGDVGERVWNHLRAIDAETAHQRDERSAFSRRSRETAEEWATVRATTRLDTITFDKALRLSVTYDASSTSTGDDDAKTYGEVFVERVGPGATGAPNLVCVMRSTDPAAQWVYRTFKVSGIQSMTDLDTGVVLVGSRKIMDYLFDVKNDNTGLSMAERAKIVADRIASAGVDDVALARMMDTAITEGAALGRKDFGDGKTMNPDAHAHLYPTLDILREFRTAYVEAYLDADATMARIRADLDDLDRPIHQDEIDETKPDEPTMTEIMDSIRRLITE